MKLISFDAWEDDEWSNRLWLMILWPLIFVLMGFAFITQSFTPLAYAIIAFITGVMFTFEAIAKRNNLVPPVLGFGKKKNVPIAIVVGIMMGLIFILPLLAPSIPSFSMASLVTTQEATLIQHFFQSTGLYMDINTVSFWVNFFYQVITPMFIEEAFFRGLMVPLFSWLFKNWRVGVAAGNGGFAFYHLFVYGANPSQVAFAFFFGIVGTLADYKMGSLLPSVVGHFINNTAFGGFFKVTAAVAGVKA